ncbi:MAG: hypothetical protein RL479_46, partial [Verrucomicrobiota bacterium]
VVFSTHGDCAAVSPHAVPHWEISGFERLFDFNRGAKVTGAGFPFYVGDGARIVRALLRARCTRRPRTTCTRCPRRRCR